MCLENAEGGNEEQTHAKAQRLRQMRSRANYEGIRGGIVVNECVSWWLGLRLSLLANAIHRVELENG